MAVVINEMEMQQQPPPDPAASPPGDTPTTGGGPVSSDDLHAAWRDLQWRAARLVAD